MMETEDPLKALISEYSVIKAEIKTYIELFHRQTNFVILLLTTAGGIVSVGATWFSKSTELPAIFLEAYVLPWPFAKKFVLLYQILAFFVYLILAMVGWFFVSASLSYIYIIAALAKRGAVVERHINELCGREVMVWEQVISPKLIGGFVRKGLWVSPSATRIAWSFAILGCILGIQVLTAKMIMGRELGWIFIAFVCLAGLFEGIQIVEYMRVGVPFINQVVEQASGAQETAGVLGDKRLMKGPSGSSAEDNRGAP